jgi:hypothetical protein
VIEVDFFPVFLDVASLALPEVVFVLIVLLVTRSTGRLQLAFDPVVLVATRAFDLLMLEEQMISGFLVVIEAGFFPVFLDVAIFAFGSENALMPVVLLVARNTGSL